MGWAEPRNLRADHVEAKRGKRQKEFDKTEREREGEFIIFTDSIIFQAPANDRDHELTTIMTMKRKMMIDR